MGRINCKKMSQLNRFSLASNVDLPVTFKIKADHALFPRFKSRFWCNRKWSLHIEIKEEDLFYLC